MEFGALQCLPKNPDCEECIFKNDCVAFHTGSVERIPFKKKSNDKKDRYFNYVVLRKGRKVLLRKRMEKDIWQNMYDFPVSEVSDKSNGIKVTDVLKPLEEKQLSYKSISVSDWKTRVLSHQRIHARFHEIEINKGEIDLPLNFEFADLESVDKYPLPKLIEVYISGL